MKELEKDEFPDLTSHYQISNRETMNSRNWLQVKFNVRVIEFQEKFETFNFELD